MGMKHMGYGLMTLDRTGNVQLSVLWLPSRFYCLYLYLLYIGISLLAFFAFSFFKAIFVLKTFFVKTKKTLIYKRNTSKYL